jgi:hypothetical protein
MKSDAKPTKLSFPQTGTDVSGSRETSLSLREAVFVLVIYRLIKQHS